MTPDRSSITRLPTAQMLEALDEMDNPIELRKLAQEVNVAHSPDTTDEDIKAKIREVAEHFQERDGTPQIETHTKRMKPGTPIDAPALAVAGEESIKLGDAQKVEDPNDLKGPDRQELSEEEEKAKSERQAEKAKSDADANAKNNPTPVEKQADNNNTAGKTTKTSK